MTGGMEFWLAVHSSNPRLATSALGQKQTFSNVGRMSALPPKAASAGSKFDANQCGRVDAGCALIYVQHIRGGCHVTSPCSE